MPMIHFPRVLAACSGVELAMRREAIQRFAKDDGFRVAEAIA